MASMTSFEIITPPENLTNSKGAHSSGFYVNSSPQAYENATQTSISSVSSFDSRAIEMQEQVDELIKENNLWKDKVKKSNIVMLEQLNTISTWKKEIKEYKEKQNNLLEEKQNSIDSLTKEKKDLQKRVEELENSFKASEIRSEEHAKCLLDEQKLSGSLRGEKKELEELIKGLNEELNNLWSKFKALETENKDLREISKSLYNDIALMENSSVAEKSKEKPFATVFNDDESGYAIVFKEESDGVSAPVNAQLSQLTTKYIQLQAEFDDEKVKSSNLEQQLEEKNKQIGILTEKSKGKKKKHHKAAAVEDCEELAFALWAKTDQANLYQKRFEELEKELEEVKIEKELGKAEIIATSAQLKAVQHSLKEEEYSSELQRKSLIEAEKNLKQLSDLHERAMKLLGAQEESEMMKSEQLSTMKDISERHHIEQLDVLTAKLFNMEQLLEDEQEKNEMLQKEMDLLKQQFEKASLSNTENSKIGETGVKKLTEEQKKQKKPKVESRRGHERNRPHHFPRKHRGHNGVNSLEHGSNSSDGEEKQFMKKFECPHCKVILHDKDSLEDHLQLCMNDDIFCV